MAEEKLAQSGGPQDVLMEIRHLKKWFPVKSDALFAEKKYIKAVDDVSLSVARGTTLGIVGESGCGKSTLARVILRLLEPTDGAVLFHGQDITKFSGSRLRRARREMQMIFQDPYASLNPRLKVGESLIEPFRIHRMCSRRTAQAKAAELLDMVGLSADSLEKYPHEFSGGQRQRICIARALAVHPELVICDECVSALDVSIQAQIVNLLVELQKQLGLTLIFISHDLRIVRHIASQIAVMYLGKVVESAPKKELFEHPRHPYTRALLSAVPVPDPDYAGKRIVLTGDLPSPISPPSGCAFRTRCFCADEECSRYDQTPVDLGQGHFCMCRKVGKTQTEQ